MLAAFIVLIATVVVGYGARASRATGARNEALTLVYARSVADLFPSHH